MTDASGLANDVASDVVDEIDVGSVVTGDDVTDGVDGESLGRSIGETLGETVGRLVGRNAVRWLASKLAFWADEEDPSLLARLSRALLVAVGRTLRKPEFRDPLGDALRNALEGLRSQVESAEDAATDAGERAAEGATETAEAASDAASSAASDAAERLESAEMDELRKETYRDLLEMMEYSELQSIAKEAGVKANQQREEMTDAIVEAFDAEDEADSGGEEPTDDEEE